MLLYLQIYHSVLYFRRDNRNLLIQTLNTSFRKGTTLPRKLPRGSIRHNKGIRTRLYRRHVNLHLRIKVRPGTSVNDYRASRLLSPLLCIRYAGVTVHYAWGLRVHNTTGTPLPYTRRQNFQLAISSGGGEGEGGRGSLSIAPNNKSYIKTT